MHLLVAGRFDAGLIHDEASDAARGINLGDPLDEHAAEVFFQPGHVVEQILVADESLLLPVHEDNARVGTILRTEDGGVDVGDIAEGLERSEFELDHAWLNLSRFDFVGRAGDVANLGDETGGGSVSFELLFGRLAGKLALLHEPAVIYGGVNYIDHLRAALVQLSLGVFAALYLSNEDRTALVSISQQHRKGRTGSIGRYRQIGIIIIEQSRTCNDSSTYLVSFLFDLLELGAGQEGLEGGAEGDGDIEVGDDKAGGGVEVEVEGEVFLLFALHEPVFFGVGVDKEGGVGKTGEIIFRASVFAEGIDAGIGLLGGFERVGVELLELALGHPPPAEEILAVGGIGLEVRAEKILVPGAMLHADEALDVGVIVGVALDDASSDSGLVLESSNFLVLEVVLGENLFDCMGEGVGNKLVAFGLRENLYVGSVLSVDAGQGFDHRGNVVDGQSGPVLGRQFGTGGVIPLVAFEKGNRLLARFNRLFFVVVGFLKLEQFAVDDFLLILIGVFRLERRHGDGAVIVPVAGVGVEDDNTIDHDACVLMFAIISS